MLAILVIVSLIGVVTAGHMLSTSQIMLTSRSADVDAMQTTGEGLLDFAYGAWKSAMVTKLTATPGALPLTTAEASAVVGTTARPALPAWMQYEEFYISALDASGKLVSPATRIPSISQEPKGWQASTYQYVARVTLVSTNAGPKKRVKMESILRNDLVPPVNGLFYCEGDFELYKPAPMMISGNVHTNGNGWVTTHGTTAATRLRFLSPANVSHAGSYEHAAPPKATLWSPINSATDIQAPTYDRGYAEQVSHSEKMEGIGLGTVSEFNTTDGNPNNDGNRELIEPPVAGQTDPAGIANSRLYNNAGLVVEISGPVTGAVSAVAAGAGVFTGNNVKITAKNGTSLTTATAASIISTLANSMTVTTNEQQQVWNPVTKKYEWKTVAVTSTVQKTVYDKREAKEVLVSDVNLGALNTTLNALSGFNNILYLQNTADVGANPKAIRLNNAGVLPNNGLTVASSGGLYVIGDYNTGKTTDPAVVPSNVSGNPDGTSQPYKTGYATKPAALVADAVMFLSNNWSDSNDAAAVSSRSATHTTVNSAVIAGYVPSGWTNPATGEVYWYSGGANNFPRFLENWNSKGMTFNGAMVQLFKSQMFVGEWDTADIYSPPNRRWSFDPLLLERVLPGIPSASSFSRAQLRPLPL